VSLHWAEREATPEAKLQVSKSNLAHTLPRSRLPTMPTLTNPGWQAYILLRNVQGQNQGHQIELEQFVNRVESYK